MVPSLSFQVRAAQPRPCAVAVVTDGVQAADAEALQRHDVVADNRAISSHGRRPGTPHTLPTGSALLPLGLWGGRLEPVVCSDVLELGSLGEVALDGGKGGEWYVVLPHD